MASKEILNIRKNCFETFSTKKRIHAAAVMSMAASFLQPSYKKLNCTLKNIGK